MREGFIRHRKDYGDRSDHRGQRNGDRRRDFEVELGEVRPLGVERANIVRNREVGVLNLRRVEDETQFIRPDTRWRSNNVASPAATTEGVRYLRRTACAKCVRW